MIDQGGDPVPVRDQGDRVSQRPAAARRVQCRVHPAWPQRPHPVDESVVRREGHADNARATDAVLTADGLRVIENAAPGHVDAVRRHFIDLLTDDQIDALGDATETIVHHLRTLLEEDPQPTPGPVHTPVVTRWVLHVDLDQFVAAVEVLRHPELAGRPVVVGGAGDPTQRAVVATASYEAREFGVHSGMPLRTAAKRCPELVFLPADHDAYEAASAEVMATLRGFDAVVEVLGWDEAFLEPAGDPDGIDPEALARDVQQAVLARTRLACSVGIGDNKLRAKLATAFGKPAGMFRLTARNWFAVLGERPTDALWGIGRRTAGKLAGLGLSTVRELAAADPGDLAERLGPAMGPWYVQLGRGIDTSPVVGTPHVPRSRSRETTFQQNLTDWAQVRTEVAALARRVHVDVVDDGRAVTRVAVKVRFAPFFTYTRSSTLDAPTLDVDALAAAALDVLERFDHDRAVRLLGVRLEFEC